MQIDVITRIYMAKTRKAINYMNKFCKENKIENNFNTFLFYEFSGFCSPAYYYLHFFPKLYLANSRSYRKYHKQLDKDFQDDILPTNEIRMLIKQLKRDEQLLEYFKSIQGDDSYL